MRRYALILLYILGFGFFSISVIIPQQVPLPEQKDTSEQPVDSITLANPTEQVNTQPSVPSTPVASAEQPITQTTQSETSLEVDSGTQQSKKTEIRPSNDEYYDVFITFMHTQKNILAIKKAYAIHEGERINATGSAGSLTTETSTEELEEEVGEMTNNVYLNSIFFISPNNWSVWINDKKISDKTNGIDGSEEFFVEKVSRNDATLVQRISRGMWRILNTDNPQSDGYNYRLNNETKKIELIITLHPNQTFVVTKNQIFDGRYNKVESLEIENTNTLGGDDLNTVIVPTTPEGDLNFDELFNNF
ncbi:MAG: hypothetical protein LBG48_04770 [Rickettsiales bacterium]|nr:hypothetical protein [Rickettsiales bacterium]